MDGGGDESSVQHAIVAPTRNRIHQDTHADTTESKQGEPGSPSASSALDTYCAVCMSEGCDAFLLPCQHNFHAACILQWVESDHQVPQHRLSCPLCRQSIEQFVPLEAAGIEDRSGDMLERFLKVWEKHYMSRGPAPGAAGAGSGGAGGGAGGADDGEQLIKPGSTQEIDESQKQQTQQGLQSPQGSSTVIDTLSAANTNTESTAEQNAWQQLYQDVFFIPDSLPDDFIIPHAAAATGTDHVAEQMSMLQEEEQRRAIFRQDHHMAPTSAAAVAAGDNHANNIAAVDGGLTSGGGTGSSALGGSLGFLASTPFALLNSLLSAFKTSTGASGAMTPLRSPIAARRPVRPVQRILFPEASADEEGAESEHAIDSIRILEPDSSSSAASSASASSSAELETVPPPLSGSPTPSAMMPVFAGSVAGAATVVSQTLTYGRGAGALAPSPAYASIPAIAAYFTSYEMMKQELSLSPSLSSAAITGVDPRAALLNAESTAGYFAAAGTAGAISNVVKLTLSPGLCKRVRARGCDARRSQRGMQRQKLSSRAIALCSVFACLRRCDLPRRCFRLNCPNLRSNGHPIQCIRADQECLRSLPSPTSWRGSQRCRSAHGCKSWGHRCGFSDVSNPAFDSRATLGYDCSTSTACGSCGGCAWSGIWSARRRCCWRRRCGWRASEANVARLFRSLPACVCRNSRDLRICLSILS